jgi:hypothetical protein
MKSYIFWDIMPRTALKFNRRFGGTYCRHLQHQIGIQTRNQLEAGSVYYLHHAGFLLG